MAGSQPGFDPTAFRTAIRFVYDMAAPPDTDDQVAFYFASVLVYNKSPLDGDDVPFDPTATVTRTQPDPVKVPCAVEYFDAAGQETVFGSVDAARIVITLLDEDYAQVKGFAYVVLGGQKYLFKRTEPPSGLFDVGLFTVVCIAEDEI